jgi:hypothetical protein
VDLDAAGGSSTGTMAVGILMGCLV